VTWLRRVWRRVHPKPDGAWLTIRQGRVEATFRLDSCDVTLERRILFDQLPELFTTGNVSRGTHARVTLDLDDEPGMKKAGPGGPASPRLRWAAAYGPPSDQSRS
jgi:hypothetical protein